jgi:hypothetical protein
MALACTFNSALRAFLTLTLDCKIGLSQCCPFRTNGPTRARAKDALYDVEEHGRAGYSEGD